MKSYVPKTLTPNCDAKTRHWSYVSAEKALVKPGRRRGKRRIEDSSAAHQFGGKIAIYECRQGGKKHYHVGHNNQIRPKPYKRYRLKRPSDV
jgi:hypothetical protein